MAESVSPAVLEKLWIHKALDTQRKVLVRSRQAEMVGSEIWVLRGKEIDYISKIMEKYV